MNPLRALKARLAHRSGAAEKPPLPDNPYRRFYTAPRRLEELAPQPAAAREPPAPQAKKAQER